MLSNLNNIDQLHKEIDTILNLTKGTTINICYAIYKIIEKALPEDKPELLRYVAEIFGTTDSSDEIIIEDYISEYERNQLTERYGKLVDELLAILLKDNQKEEDFYISVMDMIHNPLFMTEKAKSFVLYYVLIDKRIPYFRLEQGLKLSNEDFKTYNARLRMQRAKIRFILATDFHQKSEEADLLLKEIDKTQGTERILLMVHILWRLREDARIMVERAKRSAE